MCLLLFIIFLIPNCFTIANEWDDIRFYNLEPGKKCQISMSGGFFVNRDTVVTNKHVVEQ